MITSLSELSDARRLRVLLVPDRLHWIYGTVAKEIARWNPWIDASICSVTLLQNYPDRYSVWIETFDIVHVITRLEYADFAAQLPAHTVKIASVHHVDSWENVEDCITADAVMVSSGEWWQYLRHQGISEERLALVPYGVDTGIFYPASPQQRRRARQRFDLPDQAITVGFFGKCSSNPDDRKGVGVFLEAISALQSKVDARLAVLIVGPGWQELAKEIARSGILCQHILFCTHEQVPLAFAALDVYWVTSRLEGGPVTVLEASIWVTRPRST